MSTKNFLNFMAERDQLDEAFNSAPYELTMGKKGAGDVFFTFIDEDDKEYRIQFYTPQGLGKNVRQVFIGQKRGSTYPDAIARFKNPMRVIASMIEATKQFLATPLGKTIDGYAVNFSKKALDRGMTLIPKIIRQSGLKQKLNVMDLTYAPVPDRGYVWLVKKGKDPAQVFDGPKMQGITWDDPDKIGDVPPEQPEQNVSSPVSIKNGIAQHMTSQDMDSHPFRRKVLSMIDAAVQEEGIATPGSSKGFYKFTNGGSFRVYFDKVQNDTFFGSLSTAAGNVEITSPFNADYVAGDFLAAIRKAAPKPVDNTNGWKLTTSGPTGKQPMMLWSGKEKRNVITADIIPHAEQPGVYIGGLENGNRVRAQSPDTIARNLKLPQIPLNLLNDFTQQASSFWKRNNGVEVNNGGIVNNLKMPANAKLFGETDNGFSVTWDLKFPDGGDLSNAKIVTNVTYNFNKSKADINNILVKNGKSILSNSHSVPLDVSSIQNTLDGYSKNYENAAKQLSLLASPTYNPDKLFLNDVTVDQFFEIRFQGQSLKQSQNRSIIIDTLARSQNKSNEPKGDLSAYASSIEGSVPQGRDLDWQVYTTNKGKSLKVVWDITFRRNSRVGAMKEFSAQISRANQYLETVYDDAKRKGYSPDAPNLMTMAAAQRSDEISVMNGDGAYSEYEQSIGGSLTINLK